MRITRSALFLTFFLLFICTNVFGANVTVTATVDKNKLYVGDTLTYTIECIRGGSVINMATPQRFDGFVVVGSFSSSNATFMNGEMEAVTQQKYELAPAKRGTYSIGPAVLQYTDAATGKTQVLQSNTVTIQVLSSKSSVPQARTAPQTGPVSPEHEQDLTRTPTPEEIRDIKGSLPDHSGLPWWFYCLVVLGVLAIVWYFLRPKKTTQPGGAKETGVSLEQEIANDLLMALKAKDRGELTQFYLYVSLSLRKFYVKKYNIGALESTTNELLKRLNKVGMDKKAIVGIGDILEECDLVKFAKHEPSAKEAEEVYRRAVSFIKIRI